MYREGHVIVQRHRRPEARKRGRAPAPAWTLHKDTCFYLSRGKQRAATMPAPIDPYGGTIACRVCKPTIKARGVSDGHE
jgi:hypothetical protein